MRAINCGKWSIALLFCLASNSLSQPPKNSAYVELLGNGLFWSANYERNIFSAVYLRAGQSYPGFDYDGNISFDSFLFIPMVGVNPIIKSFRIDLGIGPLIQSSESDVIYVATSIGLRSKNLDDGVFWKISFTPFSYEFVLPWLGASAGWAF